jgi:hypothetical protein
MMMVDVTNLTCGGEVLLRGVGCFAVVVVVLLLCGGGGMFMHRV